MITLLCSVNLKKCATRLLTITKVIIRLFDNNISGTSDVGGEIMIIEPIKWLGFIISTLFLLWVLRWSLKEIVPELISEINYYVKKHSKLVVILSAVTIAMSIFLFINNGMVDITAIFIMMVLSVPIFIFFTAILLELVKSPYADKVGDLFFRLKEPMGLGTIFFMIGCFVYLILDFVM